MMSKLMVFAGMTVGGWIGWALAARFGLMWALFASLVGSAVALYWTRRLVRDYLP
ncbi:MAG: hypothetical protein HYR73_05150 [Candidatus Eisenbacteria bacterium]|nr:hypothetical protein [Candidatus Eisenbacteria bacterium]